MVVNIYGPKQRMPKDFTQALKPESLHLSNCSNYWQKCGAEMSMLTPCELNFEMMKSTYRYNVFGEQRPELTACRS